MCCIVDIWLTPPPNTGHFRPVYPLLVNVVYGCLLDWTGDFLNMRGDGFSLDGGGRIYFASQPNDGWSPDMYWQVRGLP